MSFARRVGVERATTVKVGGKIVLVSLPGAT